MTADLLVCFLSHLPEVGVWEAVSLCSGVSRERCCIRVLKEEIGQGM